MPTLYNRIQSRNLDRLAALSDGIFAVAMTLLIPDLHIPTAAQVCAEGELLRSRAAELRHCTAAGTNQGLTWPC